MNKSLIRKLFFIFPNTVDTFLIYVCFFLIDSIGTSFMLNSASNYK